MGFSKGCKCMGMRKVTQQMKHIFSFLASVGTLASFLQTCSLLVPPSTSITP